MPPNNSFEVVLTMDFPAHESDDNNEGESSVRVTESPPRQDKTSKRVSWGSICVREHPIIPGDNPSAIGGVPVTIHWDYVEETILPIEELDPSQQSPPRSMIEMRMPPDYRNDLLRRLGFSRGDVAAALKAANIARGQRRRTAETMNLASVEESLEKVKRATLNATFRRSKKIHEKKLLETFRGKSANCTEKDCKVDGGMDGSGAGTVGTSAETLRFSSSTFDQQKVDSMPMQCRRHRDSILIR